MCYWQNEARESGQQLPRCSCNKNMPLALHARSHYPESKSSTERTVRRAQLKDGGGLQQLICNHSLNHDVSVTASLPCVSSVRAWDTYLQAIGRKQAVMLNQMMLGISRKTEMKMSNLLSFGVLSPEHGQEGLQEVV